MKVGTSSGKPQSAIIIPVPAVESAVGPWRQRCDPVADAGVPAHVTLIVPWVAPERITDATLADLERQVAGTPAWDFRLTDLQWFGDRVLWLAPEPAAPFRRLTRALASHFGTPPWEGKFDDLVPHLTIGHADPERQGGLEAAHDALAGALPLQARAEEIRVMCGDGQRWTTRARIGLAGAPSRQPMASKMAFSSSEGPAGTV